MPADVRTQMPTDAVRARMLEKARALGNRFAGQECRCPPGSPESCSWHREFEMAAMALLLEVRREALEEAAVVAATPPGRYLNRDRERASAAIRALVEKGK